MDYNKTLDSIIEFYEKAIAENATLKAIAGKAAKGAANYAEAEEAARICGSILNAAFEKYLPEALIDGRLYQEAAEIVLRQPLIKGGKSIAAITAEIQQALNENAGLGIKAITPALNMDQLNGIIYGIVNAETYEAGKESFFDAVENFYEGYVDDFARDNAEFLYQAGREPVIERVAAGKCCEWCEGLAGRYRYSDIRGNRSDIFRRHKNCHCMILYNPADHGGRSSPGHRDRVENAERQARIADAQRRQDQQRQAEREARAARIAYAESQKPGRH